MTIPYIYVFAGYAFWLYILIYITVRMLYKIYRKSYYEKHVKYIENFVVPQEKEKTLLERYQLAKISDDDRLFKLSCECYLKEIKNCTPQERDRLKAYLTRLVDYKIYMTSKHNRLTRCLIIASVLKCNLKSKRISQFLTVCQKNGEAQRQWLIYSKEFIESMQQEEDRWAY